MSGCGDGYVVCWGRSGSRPGPVHGSSVRWGWTLNVAYQSAGNGRGLKPHGESVWRARAWA